MSEKLWSHSRVECFNTCKRQFKYRYVDKLETLPNYDPQNPLIIGAALHHGVETTTDEAIQEYLMTYPVINSLHTYEQIKLEYWIPRVKELVETLGESKTYEYEINTDIFHGFIDLLVKNSDGTYSIYDFKYSNNINHYLESPQLSLYKYFYEKQTGNEVSKLGFIFVPKVMIRQKKTESECQFINRLLSELDNKKIELRYVDYDEKLVRKFREDIKAIESETEYEQNIGRLCDFCQYKEYCHDGNDMDIINELSRKEE